MLGFHSFICKKDPIGSHLAHKLNPKIHTRAVPKLRCPNISYSQNPRRVLKTFLTNYSTLYKASVGEDAHLRSYMEGLPLPQLATEHRSRMEAPFTAQEVLQAITATKVGSAPGLDGFPTLYYCQFQDLFVPHMVCYFNALRGWSPPGSSLPHGLYL